MLLRTTIVASGFLAAAASAGAQGCVIDSDRPATIKGAKFGIGKLADETGGVRMSEKPAHLLRTSALLVEDVSVQRQENQIARWYLLGKAYSIWLTLEGGTYPAILTRGQLGLTGDQKAPYDLYYGIDSAFSKVEALNAACSDSTEKYRGGVAAIAYNRANKALEAGKNDSAIALARRALIVNPKGAAPWNILAEANQRRGDSAGFKEALIMVSKSVDKEPAMVRVREQALYNLGIMELLAASKAQGEQRKALAQGARKYLEDFLAIKPNDPRAMGGLSQALQIMGDSAAARQMMSQMLEKPEIFTAATLFEAAYGAFNAGGHADAVRLYELGLKKNPYHRDALFSLTSALTTLKRYDEAVVTSAQLLKIDPNSVPNYTQAWTNWRGVMQASTNEALKAVAADSSIHYAGLRTSSPISVEMRPEFVVDADSATLPGAVHNRSDAPKSYSITFEFVNATGAVVATTEAKITDVPAKTGKPFTVVGKGKGIVGWRYKPIQ